LFVIDPNARLRAEEKDGMNNFARILFNIWNFILKIVVSLISLGIFLLFGVLLYILFYRRKLYNEMWQGMANQYQELPEDRIYEVVLPASTSSTGDGSTSTIRVCAAGKERKSTQAFDFEKHEGFINGEYRIDGHQLRIWGKDKVKLNNFLVDQKAFVKMIKKSGLVIPGTFRLNDR
jgi:hypothetical protein